MRITANVPDPLGVDAKNFAGTRMFRYQGATDIRAKMHAKVGCN